MNNIFLENSIPSLHQKIKKKEYSFYDLADQVAKTIENYEDKTHAWVRYDLNQVKVEADKAQLNFKSNGTLRSLEGIPFGVKDIFNTKLFSTEMGSPIWKDFRPGNNARVVDSLLFSGGIIAGKTVTAEFAVHALNETLNPHDQTKTPGTSSSGSAAAVARGMVPFALSTQTAGSIIRPASFCGVWGMKPSFGLIPRTGVLKTTDSLDTIGFVASHAENLKVILDGIRVKGPNYPFVFKNIDSRGPTPKANGFPWRVGFVKTHTWNEAERYSQEAIETLANTISYEKEFIVEEIEWPEELNVAHSIHSIIYTKSLSYYFKNEKKMSSQITSIMSKMIADGEPISPKLFKQALEMQSSCFNILDKILAKYDFVISLGTSSSAPERGCQELPDPSLIWTLCHIPSVAVPMFRCPNKLPFGAQLISRKWNDYLLLQGVSELISRGILPKGSQEISSQSIITKDQTVDFLVENAG